MLGLRHEVILTCGAEEGRLGSWLHRDPKQLWGLADPGWHLTWVHGVKQVVEEQAESQTFGLHESNHSGSQLFLKGED